MSSKHVTLVGHCGPDSSFLRMAVSSAAPGTSVSMADSDEDLQQAIDDGVDLLLFNRVLEAGFSDRDGVSVLGRIKKEHPGVAVMMVSNFEETQQAAEEVGAVPGFGKREIGSPKVRERIRTALGVE